MNLKEARELARKVGATISETTNPAPELGSQGSSKEYTVRLGVIRMGSNGVREEIVLHASTPREAADLAVVETGRAARQLLEVAKQVYSDSDLIFGAPKA